MLIQKLDTGAFQFDFFSIKTFGSQDSHLWPSIQISKYVLRTGLLFRRSSSAELLPNSWEVATDYNILVCLHHQSVSLLSCK
jgi:hypothetical protein